MEEMMMQKPNSTATPAAPSPRLGMHRDSQAISKVVNNKPKIRIIHIFAPEIIKTDVANFRELVQRLTGKPSTEKKMSCCKREKKQRIHRIRENHDHHHLHLHNQQQQPRMMSLSCNDDIDINTFCGKPSSTGRKLELRNGGFGFGILAAAGANNKERMVKEEEEEQEEEMVWNNNGNNGGCGFFGEFDGFTQELEEFPFLPLEANHYSHLHGFGETQLA